MHRIQQMGRRARRATPVVRHRAEREMIVNLARVHRAANADELQQALDVPAARDAPRRLPRRGCIKRDTRSLTKP